MSTRTRRHAEARPVLLPPRHVVRFGSHPHPCRLSSPPLISCVVFPVWSHCSPPRTCSRSGARRGRGPACEDDRPPSSLAHQERPGSSPAASTSSQEPGPPLPLRLAPARIQSPRAPAPAGVTGFTGARRVRAYGGCYGTNRPTLRPSRGGLERTCWSVGRPDTSTGNGEYAHPAPSRERPRQRARSVGGGSPRWSGPSDRAGDRATHSAARRGGTPAGGHPRRQNLRATTSWPPHSERGAAGRLDHATPPPWPVAAHARCQNEGGVRTGTIGASSTSTSTAAAHYKSDGTAKTLYHIHLSIHKRVDNRLVPAPQNSLLHSTYSSAAACYTLSLIDTTKTRHGKRRTKY